MIAPRYSDKDPHRLAGTVIYYAKHMDNGLAGMIGYIARSYGIDRAEVPDLKQDVFITLANGARKDPDRYIESPEKYIWGAVINACRELQRSVYPRERANLRRLTDYWDVMLVKKRTKSPVKLLQEREELDLAMVALSRLPQKTQSTFQLRWLDGFSYERIAEITGEPINTLLSRVRRARKTLSDMLR